MTEFIVLSVAQCDKLFPADPKTGSRERLSKEGHALNPIPLQGDAEFILPVEILTDPEHAEALKALAAEPHDDTAIKELPPEKQPKPIESKDAVDLKNPTAKRVVLPTEFKVSALEAEPAKEGDTKPEPETKA